MTRKQPAIRFLVSLLITVLTLFATLPSHGQDNAFSLEQAIAYAIENNRDLKIEQLNIADAEGQLLEYKSIGIPKIDLNGSYNYYIDLPTQIFPDLFSPAVYGILMNEGLIEQGPIPTGAPSEVQFGTDHNVSAGLELNTMLFDFSWIQGLKAQRLYRDLILKNINAREYDVRATITKAYFATLIAERNYKLLDNSITNIEELLRETRETYEAGFAEKLDVDRLELSLENLRVERQNVGRSIDLTKNLLKFQMGYPITEDIVLTEDFDKVTVDLVVEDIGDVSVDFNARPEYSSLLLAEELNSVNMKVIKAGYLPSLRGFAGYTQTLQRNELFDKDESPWFPTTSVGVTLSMPIFDGLERKAKLDRAEVSLEKAQLQRNLFEQSMHLEVQNGVIKLENARESVRARKRAMDLSAEIFETAQIKYREGVGSSVELSQSEAEFLTAQNNFINALYDLLLAKTELDIALGKI